MLTVLAVGSSFGADRIGWQIAEELVVRAVCPVEICRHPVDLLSHLNSADQFVILDAVCTGAHRGRLQRLDANAKWQTHSGNSHGLSLLDVLKLAELTGLAPDRVDIFGVEIGEGINQVFSTQEVISLTDRFMDALKLEAGYPHSVSQ